jgi:glycosyltransferase involved in cell wall biosynthesis
VNFWIVTVGEPLPLFGSRDRPWRTGLLAETLKQRGHQVLWWTSTVDHFRKELFTAGEPTMFTDAGIEIQFLSGRLYRKNVSLARLVNHAQIARRFSRLAASRPSPDVILCSFPTIELCLQAVRYGQRHGVLVALDVRDLWPDIFLDVLPGLLRPAGRMLLHPLFRDAAWSLHQCDAVFGVSEAYLRWGLQRARRPRRANDGVFPLGYRRASWTAADAAALERRLVGCGIDLRLPMATFVGTFGRTYDLATVIDAARQLASNSDSNLQFILCGAGEREGDWKTRAAGLRSVAFPGWLPAAELSCLLDRSAIGLAAYADSAPQGIPNKVIEYLSAGLPVLCSLSGESRDLLQEADCGLHYNAGDSSTLARQINTLMAQPARMKAMAASARETFKSHFDAAAVYGDMADRLEGLANQHAPGRHAIDHNANG